MTPWLHIYAQDIWHSEAYVIGTREGLLSLRNALDRALSGDKALAEAFVIDGAGYDVEIHCVDKMKMDRMSLPYTDEIAAGRFIDDPIYPHQLGLSP